LTLTYVALLALLLTGLGAYQYVSLRQSLITSRVNDFRDDLAVGKTILRSASKNLTPSLAAGRAATAISVASGHTTSVVIYDSNGNKLTEVRSDSTRSPNSQLPQLSPAAMAGILKSGATETAIVDDVSAGFPLELPGRSFRGVAQLSAPMAPITDVLRRQNVFLLIGGLVALAIALITGLVLTSGTLRPLRRLTVTAGELARGDLRARSRLVPGQDEVGQLTVAFDHMADSLETAFLSQAASEQQVRRFIADASHELRTPVTALKGYIDVLRRGAAHDPQALAAALEAMARDAERMRGLVADLLMLARIDARGDRAAEDFDLRVAVGSLLDEGVPGMPPVLERSFSPEPVLVRCDRNALATIVRNLLVNACKYAPSAPQHWSVAIDGDRARLDCRDEGPGIPSADIPHVFERFYRGEKTRSREEGGSGLGLSIVDGLVQAQGGEVRLQSADGAGTTVSVWLPLAGHPAALPQSG